MGYRNVAREPEMTFSLYKGDFLENPTFDRVVFGESLWNHLRRSKLVIDLDCLSGYPNKD